MFRWLFGLFRSLFALLGLGDKRARKRLPKGKDAPKREARGASERESGPAKVRVRYEPSIDGDADPGEVVWTWVPFEDDPSQGKDRPVLIIGTRARTLVAVPLTSKQKDRAPQVSVGEGPWDRERRTSYARVDRLIDVDPARVRREGAIMPRDRFDAVIRAVREWHGPTVIAR